MSLEQTLRNTVYHLRSGRLMNEAQVKQAVILPVLRALDWDDTDPEAFRPEYSVGKGLVDYALLDHGQALVFVEAKRVGNLDAGGEEQLFRYAAHNGVPLLVLTDGNPWNFYLSMAPGVPAKRRFHHLELLQLEDKVPEYLDSLEKHLRKNRVVSGEAMRNAEQRLANNRERERARSAIPKTWRTLLKGPDETLRDLLAEAVESACGIMPGLDDVESFLRERLPPTMTPREPDTAPRPVNPAIAGFIIEGERVETGTAIRTLIEILKRFDRSDPEFMARFAPKAIGTRRKLVARNRADLYPGRPDLEQQHARDLGNGWWLGGNISSTGIRRYVATACRIAGVEFGSQLELIERQARDS